jgi:flagellar biosynthesis chaperone FliJ
MNKKKKFRLATVLRVARLEEEAEQRRTAAANRDKQAAEIELDERAAAYAERGEIDGPTDGALFQQQAMTNALRAEALHVADVANIDARDRLELAREDLMARARRTKSLEDLEDRHNIAFAITAALAAQRSLDDMVRFRRKH